MWRIKIGILLMGALTLTSCSQQAIGPQIKIEDSWARPSSVTDNSTIYFRIVNDTKEADILLSADSPSAMAAEIHESMASDNGVMSMKPRENVQVPAGVEVVFKPGGLHIMLVNLKQSLAVGDIVSLTLRFEKAGEIMLNVKVREP